MTIKTKSEMKDRRPEIDLTGPCGNAYVLMGIASNMARQLGRDPEPIIVRMKAGNYNHLLEIFEAEFGEYVDLYR